LDKCSEYDVSVNLLVAAIQFASELAAQELRYLEEPLLSDQEFCKKNNKFVQKIDLIEQIHADILKLVRVILNSNKSDQSIRIDRVLSELNLEVVKSTLQFNEEQSALKFSTSSVPVELFDSSW